MYNRQHNRKKTSIFHIKHQNIKQLIAQVRKIQIQLKTIDITGFGGMIQGFVWFTP